MAGGFVDSHYHVKPYSTLFYRPKVLA